MPRERRANCTRHRPASRRLPGLLAIALTSLATQLTACSHEDLDQPEPIDVSLVWGEVGSSPGQFTYPRAMAVIPGDEPRLLIVDKTARIQLFNAATGEFLGGFRTPELDLGKPTGLCVAPHPTDSSRYALYVADTHYFRVLVYELPDAIGDDPSIPREPFATFGSYGTDNGQFIYPTDVAVLHDEQGHVQRIYVGEYNGNDRVSVFDVSTGADGKPVFTFSFAIARAGVPGEDPEPVVRRPQTLIIDHKSRELLLTDACDHRIGRFTLDGKLIKWIGSPDTASRAPGTFKFPYGMALLDDRTVLVSEFENARVQQIDLETGECLGVWGRPGRGEGELSRPWAVEVIGKTAFVLDSDNDRVMAFRAPAPAAEAAR
ncbi:MAG: hypothetical protein R3B57_00830 [Phycisphaerales bacterium]